MGIFDKFKGELIDIIEWLDSSRDTMVYRFERYNNEIKMGAKLIVRESQIAVFIDKGKIADIFEPGDYELKTSNLPILTTLQGWKYGFSSPFKAEVYFVNTRRFSDLKWGTKNPVTLRDPEFGPVRLRAFGTFEMKVTDASCFIKEVVGTDGHFTVEDITNNLRNLIVSRFGDVLGESKIPVLDIAANYDELGKFITDRIAKDFENYGIQLTKLLVENVSLPPEVEAVLDKKTSMGIIGNLQQYTQFQTANALEKAAQNESGLAGGGMGMGMGFAMAQQMANANQINPATPPPLPQEKQFHVAINGQTQGPMTMLNIKEMVQKGLITRDTLVWTVGMASWVKAGETEEMNLVFSNIPPPLPPQ